MSSAASMVFARGRWWRSGRCGMCGGVEETMVSWVGTVPDTCRGMHVHVHACAACVVRFDRPEPRTAPQRERQTPKPPPAPPPPVTPRAERWFRVANTALSCLAMTFAAAAFCLGLGPG